MTIAAESGFEGGHNPTPPQASDSEVRFSRERITGLVDDLFQREGIESDQRYVTVAIQGTSEFADIGRSVENRVFVEEFGNDEQEMKAEYDMYDESSTLLVVIDQEEGNLPVGCLRLIENGENGIKTINDVASERWSWQQPMAERIQEHVSNDPDPTLTPEDRVINADDLVDAGTLAVLRSHRQLGQVSTALYHAALNLTRESLGKRDWVMIIDQKALETIQAFFAEPLQEIEGLGEGEYLGSKNSRPMYLNIDHYFRRMQESGAEMPFYDASIYGILHDGIGGPIAEGFDFAHSQRAVA